MSVRGSAVLKGVLVVLLATAVGGDDPGQPAPEQPDLQKPALGKPPDRPAPTLRQLERMFQLQTRRLGADHEDTLCTELRLANALREAGSMDRAIALDEQTLAARTGRLGADHPDTLTSLNDLAVAYKAAGHVARAIELLEDVLETKQRKLG
jgi:hypothetical protein